MPIFSQDVQEILLSALRMPEYREEFIQVIETLRSDIDALELTGTGDVTGPASSTDNAITRYDGITGKSIQNSGATIDDSGNLTANNISGTNTGNVTLAAVGSSPNANSASLSGQALTLQPADGTNPGVVSTASQTFAGDKTFSGAISASNYSGTSSGTNTGDVTLAAFGSTPNANGASITSQAVNLEPADATNPGGVSTGTQTFAGNKTFSGSVQSNTSFIVQDPGAGTETITVQAPTLAGSYSLTLPVDDGSSAQFMQTDGSGVLSWSSIMHLDSDASAGGNPTESLTVTGLLGTDTILSVSQRVAGANNTAITAFGSPGVGTLSVSWTADPGAGAIVRVLVRRS